MRVLSSIMDQNDLGQQMRLCNGFEPRPSNLQSHAAGFPGSVQKALSSDTSLSAAIRQLLKCCWCCLMTKVQHDVGLISPGLLVCGRTCASLRRAAQAGLVGSSRMHSWHALTVSGQRCSPASAAALRPHALAQSGCSDSACSASCRACGNLHRCNK